MLKSKMKKSYDNWCIEHQSCSILNFLFLHTCYFKITDGEIPADRFTYHSVMVEPSIAALVLVIIGDSMCVVVALGFLSFNIYFRNNRYYM